MIAFKCSINHEDSFFRATLATDRGVYYFVGAGIETIMQRIIAKLGEVEKLMKDTDSRFCLNCGLLNIKHTTESLTDCMQALRVKNGLEPLNIFSPAEVLTESQLSDSEIMFNCPPIYTREVRPKPFGAPIDLD